MFWTSEYWKDARSKLKIKGLRSSACVLGAGEEIARRRGGGFCVRRARAFIRTRYSDDAGTSVATRIFNRPTTRNNNHLKTVHQKSWEYKTIVTYGKVMNNKHSSGSYVSNSAQWQLKSVTVFRM